MAIAFGHLLLLVSSTAVPATPQPETIKTPEPIKASVRTKAATAIMSVARKAEDEEDDASRRCAFLGRCRNFTVIGQKGTAAYRLGAGQYIADLISAGEDKHWWQKS
jgi:hypothetical protein